VNTWTHIVGVRRNGVLEAYKNGVLVTTLSGTNRDLSNVDTLSIGKNVNSNQVSLALIRISATAPTAEQIKKIYEDEKFLFQDGAQATLFGASDAVTALAHDPVTDLLHVGTNQGRSVFKGLRRVSNTNNPVSTSISVSNNFVVED
jgi:hypothetical protein